MTRECDKRISPQPENSYPKGCERLPAISLNPVQMDPERASRYPQPVHLVGKISALNWLVYRLYTVQENPYMLGLEFKIRSAWQRDMTRMELAGGVWRAWDSATSR
jgi:hypothetical protein